MRTIMLVDVEVLLEAMKKGPWKDNRSESYLPPGADWGNFVTALSETALRSAPSFLRTYIYVPRHYDFVPSEPLPSVSSPPTRPELHRLTRELRKLGKYRRRLERPTGRQEAQDAYLLKAREDVEMARALARLRVDARVRDQRDLAARFDHIEVRPAGEAAYLLPQVRLVRAIGLDIRMAVDLLMMREIYEAAIIVCGHNGLVPAIRYAKDSGKVIVTVTLETNDGVPLPRSTGRLEAIADRHIRIPVEGIAKLTNWPLLTDQGTGTTPAP